MVVADQHETQSENFTNVLEKSTLRPDVEPFVPKAAHNGQPVYMVAANGGFSLDAPEFVPAPGYTNNGDMYTWLTPSQFIVAPSTNHPRFSIPRFRDKFMRQHRSRGSRNYNNGSGNGRNHYDNNNSNNNNSDHNNNYHHQPPQQHRTFNKIEQRHHKSNNNGNSQPQQPAPKPIKIETKSKNNSKEEELLPTVVVPDIDESVMSYRAALVGAATPAQETPAATPEENKAPPTTEIEEKTEAERQAAERPDRRQDKFIPSKEEERGGGYPPNTKPPYRSGGRPKPTKGSEIQLNIFSLVQDKKVKKKKVSRNGSNQNCTKAPNALDSTAPETRRGKEREDGKPKKLSKMKKIIVKEKNEINENGGSLKSSLPGYCSQVVTAELNKSLETFLSQLREYNDRAYRTGSAHKRRYCCGLREARKYLKLNRVKCIIIPPNIDKIVSKGGLYDCVHDIVHLSSEQNIPIFYGLNKTRISKLLARPKSTITSAVSVFNYDGAEVLWGEVLHNAAIARERYTYLNDKLKAEDGSSSEGEDTEQGDGSSDEGEEFEDDNNEDELMNDADIDNINDNIDNDSVSSSFVDSGIENNEISSLSLENGHTSGEG